MFRIRALLTQAAATRSHDKITIDATIQLCWMCAAMINEIEGAKARVSAKVCVGAIFCRPGHREGTC
jgi:hypothetical protein